MRGLGAWLALCGVCMLGVVGEAGGQRGGILDRPNLLNGVVGYSREHLGIVSVSECVHVSGANQYCKSDLLREAESQYFIPADIDRHAYRSVAVFTWIQGQTAFVASCRRCANEGVRYWIRPDGDDSGTANLVGRRLSSVSNDARYFRYPAVYELANEGRLNRNVSTQLALSGVYGDGFGLVHFDDGITHGAVLISHDTGLVANSRPLQAADNSEKYRKECGDARLIRVNRVQPAAISKPASDSIADDSARDAEAGRVIVYGLVAALCLSVALALLKRASAVEAQQDDDGKGNY